MLYPVEKLIENQDLLWLTEQATVRDALTEMLAHDYSQLPIKNGRGDLTGIISEQSVARNYYHLDEKVSVLDLKVKNCCESPVTISIEQDIFDVLDLLKQTYAVVVVDEQKPVGILTNYDTTNFFRDLSEGLVLVEDIEVTLRQYIDEVLPDEKAREEAMFNAFKHLMKAEKSTAPTYEHMSFGDYITLITNGKNWSKFEELLESKAYFRGYMDQVREIRNQIAHFRGDLDAIQYDILKRTRGWLDGRSIKSLSPKPVIIADPRGVYVAGQTSGRYGPLTDWLNNQANHSGPGTEIQQKFSQIEEMINTKLPPSAREHRAWWANDLTSGRQSRAWLRTGWRVENVDFSTEIVTFRRTDSVLYQVFFDDLLARLKELRPGLTRAKRTLPQSWWNFSGGRSGVNFGWAFVKDGQLRTELYIDTGDKNKNKQYFDFLQKQNPDIKNYLGDKLIWQRLDDKKGSRIYTSVPATIRDDPEKLEEMKLWALITLQDLVDAFQTWIKELPG